MNRDQQSPRPKPLHRFLLLILALALPLAASAASAPDRSASISASSLLTNHPEAGLAQDEPGSGVLAAPQAESVPCTLFETYLPTIRREYNWRALTSWTEWAFESQTVDDLQSGPDPEWLWARTPDGLFLSMNRGRSWQPANSGIPGAAQSLAVGDDLSPATPILASWWYQVYATADGITWALDFEFPASVSFLGYVGETAYAVVGYPQQLYQRAAAGEWVPVGSLIDGQVFDLVRFGSTLYMGTWEGLFRLVGGVWEPVSFAILAGDDQSFPVWAGPVQIEKPQTELNTLPVSALLVHDGILYVGTKGLRGVYRSADGQNWTACDVGLTGAYGAYIERLVAGGGGLLFAATADGVFVSESRGERWQALHAGLRHSTTAYGMLLDEITATALTVVRDQDGETTLAAAFNREGIWMLTATEDVLLVDLPPWNPPKAVLVVGPVDPPNHNATRSNIAWADRLAAIMEQNGMQVVRVYWPNATWEDVRPVLGGASIVVYKGHGFGLGEIPPDPTEMHGGLNGFCLVHPEDPAGARLGTQDMLVTTNRLAENAIGFFFCCYCAGHSSSDPSPVSEVLARRRIEAYASTVMRMGGAGYYSGVYEEGVLADLFAHPDKSLGALYESAGGPPAHVYPHVLWPELSVWFDGSEQTGWNRAFVGDPSLIGRDVLGW